MKSLTSITTLGLVPERSLSDLRNLSMEGRVWAQWLGGGRPSPAATESVATRAGYFSDIGHQTALVAAERFGGC